MSPLSTDISESEFPDDINKPCYLNMMGEEVIFHPGHEDENPFKYFPHLQKEQEEQVQLLNEMNHPNPDNHPEGTTFEQTQKFELQNGLTIWCLDGTNDQDGFLEVFVLLGHFKP